MKSSEGVGVRFKSVSLPWIMGVSRMSDIFGYTQELNSVFRVGFFSSLGYLLFGDF